MTTESPWEQFQTFGERRNVTADEQADPERFHLLRLCECPSCDGAGKTTHWVSIDTETWPAPTSVTPARCEDCRGEGRTRQLIATCATPEALGVALVTLGREGEFEGCPIGVRDSLGEPGERWLVRPWLPSARNVSDAGRTLRQARS